MNLHHHPLADRGWNAVAGYAQVGAHFASHYVVEAQYLALSGWS